MQGEFRGDFSRDSFNPANHFSRVLMQQGRVQLDADWNEQTAILLHYLQTLAADLIGPHGGNGFEIALKDQSFTIGSGHYYVDGILCENDKQFDNAGNEQLLLYDKQSDYPIAANPTLPDVPFLVYLDVWERHISYLEDDNIREIALGGADTATRAKTVWQVKVSEKLEGVAQAADIETQWDQLVEKWQPKNRGLLKARGKQKTGTDSTNPCIIAPEAGYQGAENQLYRVEVHTGGKAENATFKWSRENGSIAVRWLDQDDKKLIVSSTGRDATLGFTSGQWIELIDDTQELLGQPGTLVQITNVEGQVLTINPHKTEGDTNLKPAFRNAKIRRWDYQPNDPKIGKVVLNPKDNALQIKEGTDDASWLPLEDGIQIQFQPGATYRTGDYWLIPARFATGDIEWLADPKQPDQPAAQPPRGIEHHYAPLATVLAAGMESNRKAIKLP